MRSITAGHGDPPPGNDAPIRDDGWYYRRSVELDIEHHKDDGLFCVPGYDLPDELDPEVYRVIARLIEIRREVNPDE